MTPPPGGRPVNYKDGIFEVRVPVPDVVPPEVAKIAIDNG